MPKKKQRASRQQQSSLARQSNAEIQRQAEQLCGEGAYKQAIELYKHLLKRETRAEWQEALAAAYLERARELAAKGMPKEAAVLWENRVHLLKQTEDPSRAEYLEWLLLAGRHGRAVNLYLEFEEELKHIPSAQRIPVLCGALLLAGNKEVKTALATQPFWLEQSALAEQVLDAYCRNQPADAVEALLKKIPFRSPFRDFRTLLKAMTTLEQEGPAAARALADKIPADSPYAGLARLLPLPPEQTLAGEDGPALPRPGQEPLMAALYGWDTKQVKVLQNLQEFGTGDEDALFKFLLRHHAQIGSDYVKQLLRQWIPYLNPQHLRQYKGQLEQLSHFEEHRVRALALELDGELEDADAHWDDCVEHLCDALDKDDNKLRAALIQRRRVTQLKKTDSDGPRELAGMLRTSIEWDPEFKPAHVEYIELCTHESFSKTEYYDAVEQALQQFPIDVEILLKGVEAAQRKNAFKKAAGYAQRILKVDPINAKAREVLVSSHLSHARKVLKQQKFHLVEKELESAAQYERGVPSIPLRINRGLLAYAMANNNQAAALLQEAVELVESTLVGYGMIFLEAEQAGLAGNDLVTLTPQEQRKTLLPALPKKYALTATELQILRQQLQPYHEALPQKLKALLQKWGGLLKKAAGQVRERDELVAMCEFFKQIGDYTLLADYAKAGLKRWKNAPVFLFYDAYAKVQGNAERLSTTDHNRLVDAVEQAKANNDERTADKILSFLRGKRRAMGGMPFGGGDLPFAPEMMEDIQEAMEKVLGGDPEEAISQLLGGREPSPMEMIGIMMDGPGMLIARLLENEGALPPGVDVESLGEMLNEAIGFEDEDDDDDMPFPFPLPRRSKPKANKAKKGRRRR